jgi:hypothetical protein
VTTGKKPSARPNTLGMENPQIRSNLHRPGQSVRRCGVHQFAGLFPLVVFVDVDLRTTARAIWVLLSAVVAARIEEGQELTVNTGPKISSVMVIDLGSLVTMTVGWM